MSSDLSTRSLVVAPGPQAGTLQTADGRVIRPPNGWALLPPGDAALTRRVKAAVPAWVVQEKVGRRTFSRGLWADGATVESVRRDLAAERATPEYVKKKEANAQRREREQRDYVAEFRGAVLDFLAFHPRHGAIAQRLAAAVAAHATPVGSGTVARTERIPLLDRAEAAVIAWMRHHTTAYDQMNIPRIKGKRREVRRMLAERSRAVLDAYRAGRVVDAGACPLQRALS